MPVSSDYDRPLWVIVCSIMVLPSVLLLFPRSWLAMALWFIITLFIPMCVALLFFVTRGELSGRFESILAYYLTVQFICAIVLSIFAIASLIV